MRNPELGSNAEGVFPRSWWGTDAGAGTVPGLRWIAVYGVIRVPRQIGQIVFHFERRRFESDEEGSVFLVGGRDRA